MLLSFLDEAGSGGRRTDEGEKRERVRVMWKGKTLEVISAISLGAPASFGVD